MSSAKTKKGTTRQGGSFFVSTMRWDENPRVGEKVPCAFSQRASGDLQENATANEQECDCSIPSRIGTMHEVQSVVLRQNERRAIARLSKRRQSLSDLTIRRAFSFGFVQNPKLKPKSKETGKKKEDFFSLLVSILANFFIFRHAKVSPIFMDIFALPRCWVYLIQ